METIWYRNAPHRPEPFADHCGIDAGCRCDRPLLNWLERSHKLKLTKSNSVLQTFLNNFLEPYEHTHSVRMNLTPPRPSRLSGAAHRARAPSSDRSAVAGRGLKLARCK